MDIAEPGPIPEGGSDITDISAKPRNCG